MRFVNSLFLLLLASNAFGQVVDTLFYNLNWQLVPRNTGVYYRVAELNPSTLQFTGKFHDHLSSGELILDGQYSNSGKKNGLFRRFYNTGVIYSSGAYDNDIQIGSWRYYYPNGKLREQVIFKKSGFIIAEAYDSYGRAIVQKGNGRWTREIQETPNTKYQLTAYFESYKRSGNWLLKTEGGYIQVKETYIDGKIEKAYLQGNPRIYYSATKFTDAIFYPASFYNLEAFSVWEATKEDYPYISWLSDIPDSLQIDSTQQKDLDLVQPDREATYPNGMKAFYRIINKILEYPVVPQDENIEGEVIVEVIIEEDGTIGSMKIIKGIGGGRDEAAIMAILAAGRWFPAQKSGQAIQQKKNIPVLFKKFY